jgi:putative flippase GtrA
MDRIKSIIIDQYCRYRELFFYGIIGGLSAFSDFCVYTLLCKFGMPYLIANVIGVHCGIICSFTLNRYYNFKVKDKIKKRFLFFYLIGLVGLLISSLMLYVMINYNHFNEIYSKIITIITVALLQFCLNKFFTFKR